MSLSGITVVGGQIINDELNSTLEERVFDIGKAHSWLGMIQRYQRPTKWGKASKKGTKVDFDLIRSQEEVETAFNELEMYLRQINRKHNIDITLDRSKEESTAQQV